MTYFRISLPFYRQEETNNTSTKENKTKTTRTPHEIDETNDYHFFAPIDYILPQAIQIPRDPIHEVINTGKRIPDRCRYTLPEENLRHLDQFDFISIWVFDKSDDSSAKLYGTCFTGNFTTTDPHSLNRLRNIRHTDRKMAKAGADFI